MEPEKTNHFPENPEQPDLPPEYCHYQDVGCEFADSCLNCPFQKCLYDEPRGKQHYIKHLRDREIARLSINDGKGIKELALMFGLSQRTVQRALKRAKNEFTPKIKTFAEPNE
jgi:DNA-binding CsgD family transcriptional regulator